MISFNDIKSKFSKVLPKLSRIDFIEIILLITYFGLWTFLEWRMYITFNLGVFDLGCNFNLAYDYSIPNFFINPSESRKLIYLIFVPIAHFFPDPFSLIVAENIFLTMGGLYLYRLAKKLSMSDSFALILCALYLFNFAFFGVTFDPIHYQSLFPVFFVMGYFYKYQNKNKVSAIFFLLSALASSLSAVIVIIYIIFLGMPTMELLKKKYSAFRFLKENIYLFLILIILSGIIITSIVFFGPLGFLEGGHFVSGSSNGSNLFYTDLKNLMTNSRLKIIYYGIVFGPYLYYIFKSKISILIIPFLILTFITSFTPYYLLRYTYTYNVSILLFIAIVQNGYKIDFKKIKLKNISFKRKMKQLFGNKDMKVFSAFISIVVVFGAIILPFGPLNGYAGDNCKNSFWDYNLNSRIYMTNNEIYNNRLIDLIPTNSSVLGESNMPQLSNRQTWYVSQTYPGYPTMDYIIVDPYPDSYNAFISIAKEFNNITKSNEYGVVAELNGSILVRNNYTANAKDFVPFNKTISFKCFENDSGSNIGTNSINFIAPGTYSIKLSFNEKSKITKNTTGVYINQGNAYQSNLHLIVSEANVTINGHQQFMMINFTTYQYLYDVNIIINSVGIKSSGFTSLSLKQLKPPKIV